VAGVGVGGYLQVGSLSSLSQVNSIIMMTAGGGGGIIFLIIGIVGTVKNHRNNTNDSAQSTSTNALSKKSEDFDTQGNTVYGPEAYERFPRVKVVGEAGPIPERLKALRGETDPFFQKPVKESFPLVYFPKQISVNGEVMDLTLNNLEKMTGIPFKFFSPINEQFRDTPLEPGWRRMSMGIISEESRGESYQEQKDRVENTEKVGDEQKYFMQQALEVAVFMHLVHAFTGRWVYPAGTYTRCIEKIDGEDEYLVVGWGIEDEGSAPVGFGVSCFNGDFVGDICGVGALRK
jgi:hypothetical protein